MSKPDSAYTTAAAEAGHSGHRRRTSLRMLLHQALRDCARSEAMCNHLTEISTDGAGDTVAVLDTFIADIIK